MGQKVTGKQDSHTRQSNHSVKVPWPSIQAGRKPWWCMTRWGILLRRMFNLLQSKEGPCDRAWHSTHQRVWICQNTSDMREEETACYPTCSKKNSWVDYVFKNTSKKDFGGQLEGIWIGNTLDIININTDQKIEPRSFNTLKFYLCHIILIAINIFECSQSLIISRS